MRARPCAVVTFALRFPVNFVHIPLSVCTRAQDHAKAMDEHSVLTDRTRAAPFPRGVAIARLLLGIESAWWLLLGTLLVVGGLIVLRGGSGLPGIVNDPPGDPPIGGWVVGVGIVIATMGGWGLWTVGSRWLLTRTMFISALLFCVVWIAIGVPVRQDRHDPDTRDRDRHGERGHLHRTCVAVVITRDLPPDHDQQRRRRRLNAERPLARTRMQPHRSMP